MKTIRLLYPDHVSGGLETYYFGAHLLAHILPANDKQPLIKVNVTPPDGREKPIEDGIYGKPEVIGGIQEAKIKLNAENPDKVITIGGNCLVSLAPFDYLHGKYTRVLSGLTRIPMCPRSKTAILTHTQWCWVRSLAAGMRA